eukprot:1674624-Pleurochrysis_carterae.AAC.1
MCPRLTNANYSKLTYSSNGPHLSSEPPAMRARSTCSSIQPTEDTWRRRYSYTLDTRPSGSCRPSKNSTLATPVLTSLSRSVRWEHARKNTLPSFALPAYNPH